MSGIISAGDGGLFDFVDSGVAAVMEEWRAPGGVVVIVEGGEVSLARGYGLADVERRVPVDVATTAFRLASISKPVTASAVLELAEQGRLDLHADVHDYLEGFRSEGPGTLTLDHLLTHTGGFEDRFLRRLTLRLEEMPELSSYLTSEMPARIYAPGEVSLYSNHGMALAGLVVAEVSGRPFGEAMRELVFAPLEMASTSFDPGAVGDRLARGYRSGEPVAVHGIKTVPSSMLVSTGADMARWMVALLAPESSTLLAPATVERMLRRHFAHHPSQTGRAYGWSEDASVSPRRLLHSGGTDGFSSAIVLVPERGGGVFVAFNGNAYVWELVREILTRRLPASPLAPTVSAPPPALAAAEIEGRYGPAELPRRSLDKSRLLFEQLAVQAEPDGSLELRDQRYQIRGDGSYASEDGRTVAIWPGRQGEIFLAEEGGAWVRLPWHAAWPLHATLLLVLTVGLATLAAGRPRPQAPDPRLAVPVRLAAALDLVFLIGMGLVIGMAMADDGGVLRFEIPWYLSALLVLPQLAIALTILGTARSVAGLTGRRGTRWSLGRSGFAFGTLFGFALFLWYWRLLGFHF